MIIHQIATITNNHELIADTDSVSNHITMSDCTAFVIVLDSLLFALCYDCRSASDQSDSGVENKNVTLREMLVDLRTENQEARQQ